MMQDTWHNDAPKIVTVIPAAPGWCRYDVFLDEDIETGEPMEPSINGPTPIVGWLVRANGTFALVPGEELGMAEFIWNDAAIVDPDGKVYAAFGQTFDKIHQWVAELVDRKRRAARAMAKAARVQ